MNSLQKFEEKNLRLFEDLAANTRMKEALEEREKDLKEQLLIAMENNGITSIDNEIIRINYIAGSESVSLDTKALRAEEPELYHQLEQKYNKRSKKNPYVRFTVK